MPERRVTRARRGGLRLSTRAHLNLLLVLFLFFCFRVAAQLIQRIHPIGFLPPFEAWHSGTHAGSEPHPLCLILTGQ